MFRHNPLQKGSQSLQFERYSELLYQIEAFQAKKAGRTENIQGLLRGDFFENIQDLRRFPS